MAEDPKQYLVTLKELQLVDRRLTQVVWELKEIPAQLESSGGEYLALSKQVAALEGEVAKADKERLSLESEIKTVQEEVLAREKRIYAITTQKEYQATLKEVAKMKQDNKAREERVLGLMEAIEKKNQELTQLKSQAADKESGFRDIEKELNSKKEELDKEEKELREKRPKLLKELPESVLEKYDFIRNRYSDPLASVVKGVCQGCFMNIPPQVFNEMLKAKDLRNCPNCNRLIYVE